MFSCKHNDVGKLVDIPMDNSWYFHEISDTNWLPAQVPGNVISDLFQNKVIPDPYFRMKESSVQWIENEDWVYAKTFDISPDVLNHDVLELLFEGLDTYADVFLNDSLILKADNMFRIWKADCKTLVKPKSNKLLIYFHSPVKMGMDKRNKSAYKPVIEDEHALEDKQTSVFTRKASYQYGWDGGPRLVTSGIWRSVHLLAWSGAKIENIYFKPIQVSSKLAIYNTEVNISAVKDQHMRLELIVNNRNTIAATDISLRKGMNTMSLSFTINDPKLWWPNGLGKPTLYDLTLKLTNDQDVVDVKEEKLGICKLEFIEQPDSSGTSFYFKVNDNPVFMKGAIYVPADILINKLSVEKIKQLIALAQKANMNMIRVWGGGIYEDQKFYDYCDEKGILVWQDFMFASSLQPGDSAHIENIRQEAIYNVTRLRNHACLALWCGNSEILENWNELGWKNNYPKQVSDKLWSNYDSLFNHILPGIINNIDSKTSYISTSPSGKYDKNKRTYSGDQHDWSVWYNGAPIEDYDSYIGRFVSEFGMQSFPSLSSLKRFTSPSDLSLNSEVLRLRQYNTLVLDSNEINGNDLIHKYSTLYYKKSNNFETLVYLSQVMQSEALKKAIECHRREKPHCMGSLYWQLNDCWPDISWSTIDYYGNLKLSYYTVCDAFAPIIAIPVRDGHMINIFGISDMLKPTEAILLAKLIDFNGKTLFVKQIPVKIEANSSKILLSIPEDEMLKNADKKFCCLVVQFNQPNNTLAQNILYFAKPGELNLQKTIIDISVNEAVSGYNLVLKAAVLVKNVGLETIMKKCEFADNNFDLLPGKRTKVNVHYNGTREEFLKDLKITSLNNCYY
jgi:beta-mannosidase